MNVIDLAEQGWIPDRLLRIGIRRLLAKRLQDMPVDSAAATAEFANRLRDSPLAIATRVANLQHYEVPVEFFQHVLGPRLKYSSCLFATPQSTLLEAEEEMLRQTCERAELEDGMQILELGCGWGSLTLWMAEQYPDAEITALSNSTSQRTFIEHQIEFRGIKNVTVITADMRKFSTVGKFDRIVSVEMFEHMRNYELLLQQVYNWLAPAGKAFVHVFCHRDTPYLFETEGTTNWMGRHFFTGGLMPSEDLFRQFDDHLRVERQWQVSGLHYWRTSEAWLRNLDQNRDAILSRFGQELSAHEARLSLGRWRMFFMACAELFRYHNGNEWFVAHYLFQPAIRNAPRRIVAPGSGRPTQRATSSPQL